MRCTTTEDSLPAATPAPHSRCAPPPHSSAPALLVPPSAATPVPHGRCARRLRTAAPPCSARGSATRFKTKLCAAPFRVAPARNGARCLGMLRDAAHRNAPAQRPRAVTPARPSLPSQLCSVVDVSVSFHKKVNGWMQGAPVPTSLFESPLLLYNVKNHGYLVNLSDKLLDFCGTHLSETPALHEFISLLYQNVPKSGLPVLDETEMILQNAQNAAKRDQTNQNESKRQSGRMYVEWQPGGCVARNAKMRTVSSKVRDTVGIVLKYDGTTECQFFYTTEEQLPAKQKTQTRAKPKKASMHPHTLRIMEVTTYQEKNPTILLSLTLAIPTTPLVVTPRHFSTTFKDRKSSLLLPPW